MDSNDAMNKSDFVYLRGERKVLSDVILKIKSRFRIGTTIYAIEKPSKHFIQIGGRRPSGLGNEIFEFGKAHIARNIVPGELLSEVHKNSIHSVPNFLKRYSTKTFRFQILLSKLFKRLLVIDGKTFIEAATLLSDCDYGVVFSHLQKMNPTKKDYLHASGMIGGYLSISSFRTELRSILDVESMGSKSRLTISFHIRGPVHFRNRPWSIQKTLDFTPERESTSSGDFNSETPLRFYLSVIENLARMKSVSPVYVQVVTNMKKTEKKILEITNSLKANEIEFEIVAGDPLDALKTLIESDLIVPSISSFSLLAIFLSDARYLWPREALFSSKGYLSIWGFESNQWLTKSISQAKSRIKKLSPAEVYLIRGLPFPSLNSADLSQWMLWNDGDYPRELDLVFYGEIPPSFATDNSSPFGI